MAEIKDRITVVEAVYHQPFGEQPSGVETRYSRELQSKEQLYERRLVIGEKWQPLDTGWIEEPGLIVLVNQEGKNLQVNPTEEERAAIAGRVVELAFDLSQTPESGAWLILPGESIRGYPDSNRLRVRCRKGKARCILYAYPR